MLHVVFLTYSFVGILGCSPQAAAEAPVLKGALKEVSAQGKEKPLILVEGTTNLPNGTFLNAYLYYDRVDEGRELAKDTPEVKDGKFSQDFQVFAQKNLAGKYVLRLRFNPALQVNAMPFKEGKTDIELQIGTAEDKEKDCRAVRDRLAGELKTFSAMGDELQAKMKDLNGKPTAEWEPSIKAWREKTIEIQRRSQPTKVPEYRVLNLDSIADGGLENLTGMLISAAKFASVGRNNETREGLTRLRQTVDYLVDEIASPKLVEPGQIFQLIESARTLLKDALAKSNDPVLPLRRKFVEMNSLLQKSLPEDFQATILEIGTRSTAFFTALSDKQPDAKQLQAEADQALEKLAAALRRPKGS